MPVKITVDWEDVRRKFGLLRERLKPAILAGLAEWLFLVTRESFGKQGTPEGAPWPALSARYAAWKAKRRPGKTMLQLRGDLVRSIIRGVEGDTAFVGSNLPYAAAHQYGFSGTVAVPAHRRAIPSRGRGKNRKLGGIALVTAHSRRMHLPARPFLPSPEFAEIEGAKQAEEIIQGQVNAAGAA